MNETRRHSLVRIMVESIVVKHYDMFDADSRRAFTELGHFLMEESGTLAGALETALSAISDVPGFNETRARFFHNLSDESEDGGSSTEPPVRQ